MLSTNFNNTRNEISAVCGERSAVLGLFNKWLSKISLKKLQENPKYQELLKQDRAFKIECIAMSSYKDIGTDKNSASPCADCLSWINTQRFFADDTKIASLESDNDGKLFLNVRTIEELLPYRNDKESVVSGHKTPNDLSCCTTKNAEMAMEKNCISQETILKLISQAQKSYFENKNAHFSSQNIAAAVLDSDNQITTGKKIDWSKRWYVEPLELAVSKVIEDCPDKKIKAAAYYGDRYVTDKGITHEDGVVSIATLGRLKIQSGSPETLVITVVNDEILIRTIDDYMPQKFSFIQDYLQK